MFRMREHDPLGFPEMGFVPPGTTDAGHVFLLEPTELRSHLVSPLLSVEPLKGYVGIPGTNHPSLTGHEPCGEDGFCPARHGVSASSPG